MIRESLTDVTIKQLKPGPRPYDVHDGHQRGLILTVLPSGLKQFNIRYMFRGKKRRLPLGDYSTSPGGVTLADARRAAREAYTAVDSGRDPAGERQKLKEAPTDAFAVLAEQYLEKWAKRKKRAVSANGDERTLNKDILPYWGDKSVAEITRKDVNALLQRITDRGALILANRTLSLVSKIFNFAIVEEWIAFNPAARIIKHPETSRSRVLRDDEIRALWRCLDNAPTTADKAAPGRKRQTMNANGPICPVIAPVAAALQLQLLTLTRPGEPRLLEWTELDLDGANGAWWMLPAEKAKNKRDHRIPLCARAEKIIRTFAPGPEDDPDFSCYVFANRNGMTVKDGLEKAAVELSRVLGFHFQLRDLRRTASTLMAERAKVPTEYISRVLNHTVEKQAKVTPVYNRYEYDDEKRAAIEAWARVLDAILANKPIKKIAIFPTVAASA